MSDRDGDRGVGGGGRRDTAVGVWDSEGLVCKALEVTGV